MPAREASLAYWLIPAQGPRQFLASMIRDLAQRYDAPMFEPHVTIYVAQKYDDNPSELLSRILKYHQPFSLSALHLQHSDVFTKTLFVKFGSNPLLTRLSHAVRDVSLVQNDYQLEPHLSLIYKRMESQARIGLLNSIRLPFTKMLFDELQAVICLNPTESREDVESWRIVAKERLTS